MNETNETKQPEVKVTNQKPPEETVGDIMRKSEGEGIKFWVIVTSVVVYLAAIVYAEVHGLSMLSKGVAPDMRIWAGLGMVAAGMTALALPLALKVWTIDSRQRIFTYFFYVADFAFLAFNSFTDFDVTTGNQLAPWAQAYVSYVLPATPILIGACWSVVWALDPDTKQKILALRLRAAMKEKLARKVADAAKGANVTATVNAAAEREVEKTLTELFGVNVRPVTGYVMEEQPPSRMRRLASGFFDYLYSHALALFSPDLPGQSPTPGSSSSPSSSSEEDTPDSP